jgi:putative transposase
LLLKVFTTEANYHDGTVASWLIAFLVGLFPRLAKIWADSSYGGRFVDEAQACGVDVEIVKRKPDQKGFEVLPRRWVVERTFAWLTNYRRLTMNYEQWVQTADAAVYAAMTHIMVRRLARLRASK